MDLIASKRVRLVAGGSDGVAAVSDHNRDVSAAAVEMKTMTAFNKIDIAIELKSKYGSLTVLPNIGGNPTSMIFS